MSNVTIETENAAPGKGEATKKAAKRKPAKKAKPVKKVAPAKNAKQPASERTNKKAEVIAMMKRAGGATLEAITQTTGWQAHTVRGFVSILGSNGGQKIESSKNVGERRYKIDK